MTFSRAELHFTYIRLRQILEDWYPLDYCPVVRYFHHFF